MSSSQAPPPSRSPIGRLTLWLPVIAYAAAIFFVSSLAQPPGVGGIGDKWGHGAAYAGLALVLLRALAGGHWAGVTPGRATAALALAAAYGASDEWHQAFVPGRSSDVYDLVADAVGAAAAVCAAWAFTVLRDARKDRI